MADPAVEAAQRHVDMLAYGWESRFRRENLIAAAREALKPIRKRHEALTRMMPPNNHEFAAGMSTVLDMIAPFIYTTEELER